MNSKLEQPIDTAFIMKKKRSIKRELLAENKFLIDLRIAILGGSSTQEIKAVLELFLLNRGIKPIFYESEYNKWYEDCMFENKELEDFQPQIVYIHTSFVNLLLPTVTDSEEETREKIDENYQRFYNCWVNLKKKYQCSIIQNNFELPFYRTLGNIDPSQINGKTRFVCELNSKFADYARYNSGFYINDINYLSSTMGLSNWYDRNLYYLSKFALSYDSIPHLCYNLTSIICAILGKNKKCLVLDLDNTLWGGIIGDDGVYNIKIGHETPVGESFLEFQKYVLELKKRGVILAVCSKNDPEIAKKGFEHPDSLLKVDDFIAFYANWKPKHLNIVEIAKDINIGLDSIVFIDDNPVERAIVRDNLTDVTVPEVVGEDPWTYIQALEDGKYFETITISDDDLKRNQTYVENNQRKKLETQFASYEDFLRNLHMQAEVKPFIPLYMDRITQLTNKTNQFNLTTKRYTRSEIEQISKDKSFITLYGRLVDKFGDNGIVSVIIGNIKDYNLHVDLWLMSCRVLKRNFEITMFQELLKLAKCQNIRNIYGYYYKTKKNAMVENIYSDFGFKKISDCNGDTTWMLNIEDYVNRETYIEVGEK